MAVRFSSNAFRYLIDERRLVQTISGRGSQAVGIGHFCSRDRRRRLGLATALIAALPAAAIPTRAWAECDPAAPTSGDTVECTGTSAGFTTNGLGSLTVDILSGTSFNGPFSASNTGVLGITNAGNLQTITLTDNGIVTFTNSGNINNGLIIVGDGDHTITNLNGNINNTFSITGNGDNSITNTGILNPGITVSGDGTLTVLNNAGSFINQQILVTGATDTTIDNYGTIQGSTFSLDTGEDVVTNYDGGTINANVLMGGSNDAFNMLGGRVNGNIEQGDGQDNATISGGEISGFLRAGTGADDLLWDGGLVGGIDMGSENDTALFVGLSDTELRAIEINGGFGSDRLTWRDTQGSRPERLLNWELIRLTSGSQLTMGGNLVLGDSGSGTGTLSIDDTSTLVASQGQHTITPATAGESVTVINAGTIDMTAGGNSVTDTLQITGNYRGDNGSQLLNTYLASDGAPSDHLIVSGTQTGTTRLFITNVDGPGDLTTDDGILVNRGIGVSDGAYVLGGVVAAGAYEYRLVQGGSDAGTENNWYLVSHATDIDGDGDGEDGDDDRDEDHDGDTDGNIDGDNDGNPDIEVPLYRPEVPIHAPVPAMGRALTRGILGTFHEREGEQVWSRRNEGFEAAWLRTFGMLHEQSWQGDLDPTFDGELWGFQAGLPVHLMEHDNGQRDVFGLFAGFGRTTGDVSGFALGQPDRDVGHLSINAYSIGGYWTHHWPNEAYVDAVLMFSWLDAESRSNRGISADIDGTEVAASIEAGIPFDITETWQIEPQGQIIWQHQDFDQAADQFSTIDFDNVDAFTGRIGARLVGEYLTDDDIRLRPFAKANIWHQFSGSDQLTYNSFTTLANEREATSLELGLGLTADFDEQTSLYANVDYSTNLGGQNIDVWEGRLGLRITW